MGYETHVIDLSSALGGAVGTGMMREVAQYFKVNEQLSFKPSTEGEHVFLYLQVVHHFQNRSYHKYSG